MGRRRNGGLNEQLWDMGGWVGGGRKGGLIEVLYVCT